jgi:hypothetical protein
MTQSNYPLRLQSSLLKEVRRLAEEEGTSVNQFINVAVAEKLSAMQVERYFRARAERANVPEAIALLERLGTEPPRPGDEPNSKPAKSEIETTRTIPKKAKPTRACRQLLQVHT